MLVAELELFHSRPVAPTRRLAIGDLHLPTEPPPGPGGMLLGGIVATFVAEVEPDLHGELVALTWQLERGARVPQPRLRHRLQSDRVGLTSHRHRLLIEGGKLRLDLADGGKPTPHVIGAIYAAGRVDAGARGPVFRTIRRALAWRGSGDDALLAHLAGGGDPLVGMGAGDEPRRWALAALGLGTEADAASVQRRFRVLLRQAHPDHGGNGEDAAERIEILTRARRILLAD